VDRHPTMTIDVRRLQALTALKTSDAAGYRAACSAIMQSMPPPAAPQQLGDVIAAATALTMGPNATNDWSIPLELVDRIVSRLTERIAGNLPQNERDAPLLNLFLHARGALLLRAGRFEEAAISLCDKTPLHVLDSEFTQLALLAIAEHRIGHADAAKEAADKARAALRNAKPQSVWDRAESELLAAEMEESLRARHR
jgi:hypothetical protein